MKRPRPAIGFAFVVAATSAPAGANPDFRLEAPGHTGVELLAGVSGAGSWHYRAPYLRRTLPEMALLPPTVMSPRPPSFIERDSTWQPSPASATGGWIYYCPTERGNRPQVRSCPQGWQLRVLPELH